MPTKVLDCYDAGEHEKKKKQYARRDKRMIGASQ